MSKKQITKKEYLSLVGLMTLAMQAKKRVDECEAAMAEIIEYKSNFGSGDVGHLSDEIWGDGHLDSALKNMDIKVMKK